MSVVFSSINNVLYRNLYFIYNFPFSCNNVNLAQANAMLRGCIIVFPALCLLHLFPLICLYLEMVQT